MQDEKGARKNKSEKVTRALVSSLEFHASIYTREVFTSVKRSRKRQFP